MRLPLPAAERANPSWGSYVDASNLRSPDEPRMTRLVMSFPDSDHLVQQWTSKEGAKEHMGRFEFPRKK